MQTFSNAILTLNCKKNCALQNCATNVQLILALLTHCCRSGTLRPTFACFQLHATLYIDCFLALEGCNTIFSIASSGTNKISEERFRFRHPATIDFLLNLANALSHTSRSNVRLSSELQNSFFMPTYEREKNFAASIFVLSIVWIASKSSFCGSPGYAGTSNVQLRSEVWNHLFHLEVAKERQFQNVFELLGCTHFKHDFWAFSKRSPSYNIFFGLCRRSQRTAYATIFMSLFRTVFQIVFFSPCCAQYLLFFKFDFTVRQDLHIIRLPDRKLCRFWHRAAIVLVCSQVYYLGLPRVAHQMFGRSRMCRTFSSDATHEETLFSEGLFILIIFSIIA